MSKLPDRKNEARFQAALAKVEANQPIWTKFNGVQCLKATHGPWIAIPHSNRRDAKLWDVVDTEAKEVLCQLKGDEVVGWLVRTTISFMEG